MGLRYYVSRYTNWFRSVGMWIVLVFAVLILIGRVL